MLARLSLLTLAMTALAGIACAQSPSVPSSPPKAPQTTPPQTMAHHEINQAMAPAHRQRHKVAITDEYGFRYDSMGDRLDATGHVIAPPHTLPGARVLP